MEILKIKEWIKKNNRFSALFILENKTEKLTSEIYNASKFSKSRYLENKIVDKNHLTFNQTTTFKNVF